ncbi:uroporphyrinogen-III synthase [Segetibacter sp. 3557_3]|uniref:uroporphyrinogen-III synthase n=1 Tax=Segetibacter sp. 3557_3 TaxID=2547429 RepID=UPI001404F5F5|nr:uroporphyrinogen-III synthase [Segetibacter sp. 3557_3]
MKEPIRILCTRPLDNQLIEMASDKGILIETSSFIETTPTITPEISEYIARAASSRCDVVITSMNAAEAVISELQKDLSVPPWHIYTMGGTTKDILQHYWSELADLVVADNAATLADKIIDENPIEVVFFCGNIRRDELPDKLKSAFIKVEEIKVYDTVMTSKKVDGTYHGILFFSPSAVESFFSANSIAEQTILFAIGNTTAATIREYCKNEVITADQPGKEHLVERTIGYFNALNN